MGRPSKRDAAKVDRVLALISDPERPLSLTAACGEVGIGRRTWSDWEAADPDLASRREIARDKGQAALERRVLSPDVAMPEVNVLRHRLGCIDAENWGERQVTVDGGKLTLADLAAADEAAGA